MIGTRLGHYHITDRLGAGGMGEVFVAFDTRLRRDVALKVLPRDVADDRDRLDRFEREATTLAALDHPGIVHIYSVDTAEEDGRTIRFLTMQLVRGRTLADMIPPRGMQWDTLLDLAIPLSQALAAAHDAGVVHRDLKPSNVMVTEDGRVKVLDFGLAKLTHDAPESNSSMQPTDLLTQRGEFLGTIPYMSPEQVAGRVVDARSDLFSLGVMLYEMATGQPPFRGDSPAELIASIVKDAPPDLSDIRADCPRDLARITRRCLEKDPRRRFHSALEVHNELIDLRREVVGAAPEGVTSGHQPNRASIESPRLRWALAVGATVITAGLAIWGLRWPGVDRGSDSSPLGEANGVASIAVLPFADMSSEGDQQYFSDGLAEELLNLLARTEGLKVAARTSSFSFRDSDLDAATIGGRLGVDHLLDGSVRKSGTTVRITAQLIDAADGFQVWSETYDRELDDIFAVQDEIARSVAGALEVTLLGDHGDPLPSRSTSVEAYNLFLQGRFFAQRRLDESDFERAIDYLQRATELDPDYALAWAGLAYARINQIGWGYYETYEGGYQDAVDAIERALELDPSLAYAWAVLAELRMELEWDWNGAEEALDRARKLAPEDPAVIRRQAELAISLGDLDRSIELAKLATDMDPLNYLPLSVLQYAYVTAGRFDEAEAALDRMVELTSGRRGNGPDRAFLEAVRGNYDAALRVMENVSDRSYRLFLRSLIYGLMGRTAEARSELQEYLDGDTIWPTEVAGIYAVMGDRDAAFEWLDRAYDERDFSLTIVKVDLAFTTLHDDPRWNELLERMGFSK